MQKKLRRTQKVTTPAKQMVTNPPTEKIDKWIPLITTLITYAGKIIYEWVKDYFTKH